MCQARKDHAIPRLNQRVDVIRAWKDEEYRQTLDAGDLADLPDNPVGLVELSDADLDLVVGGLYTAGCGCGAQPSHHCQVM
jgi:mersacidin/lichenicidin family type 2 lantibiotic